MIIEFYVTYCVIVFKLIKKRLISNPHLWDITTVSLHVVMGYFSVGYISLFIVLIYVCSFVFTLGGGGGMTDRFEGRTLDTLVIY